MTFTPTTAPNTASNATVPMMSSSGKDRGGAASTARGRDKVEITGGTSRFADHRLPGRLARQGNPVNPGDITVRLVHKQAADYSPLAVRRSLLGLFMLVPLALTSVVAGPAGAQDAPATVRLVDGDVPIGPASVDTPSGERIGRLALANHFRNVSPLPGIDPALDAAARDQLRVAIDQAGALGTLGAGGRVVRVAPDTLGRLGVVSL